MDNHSTRRAPLRRGRRIPICVSLSPETHEALLKIEGGNRSAAIEKLVKEYHARPSRKAVALEPAI